MFESQKDLRGMGPFLRSNACCAAGAKIIQPAKVYRESWRKHACQSRQAPRNHAKWYVSVSSKRRVRESIALACDAGQLGFRHRLLAALNFHDSQLTFQPAQAQNVRGDYGKSK